MQQAGWQQELGGKADCRIAQRPRHVANDLAIKLQNYGVDIDKNAVQLLEHGHRYVRDMELYVIAKVFDVSMEDLFAGTQFDIE